MISRRIRLGAGCREVCGNLARWAIGATLHAGIGDYFRRAGNGVVFVLLASLGVWGHQHHWQFPKFSEIRDDLSSTAGTADASRENPEKARLHSRGPAADEPLAKETGADGAH